ncbi:hypothetical protein DFH29DRAFT_773746, partial [Suillus ampliporus]
TSRLLTWCKDDEDACIKLFSNSVKDAKEQGRKKKQSGTSKDTYYMQLAQAIFNSNDKDPQVRCLFNKNPKSFIKPVQTRFGTLWKKYNEFNAELKQTGVGKLYAELQEDPQMKSLIGKLQPLSPACILIIFHSLADIKLEKFPWWPELHGWWRTNPAFNTAFSTTDSGQD